MRFAKHDHVVETFPADRADESLNVSILPGRSGCDRMVPNAHRSDPLQEDRTIRGVPIPNEISRRMAPRERLGDLARERRGSPKVTDPKEFLDQFVLPTIAEWRRDPIKVRLAMFAIRELDNYGNGASNRRSRISQGRSLETQSAKKGIGSA